MADKMTYKQIVHRIIYDLGYATEIAGLIERARKKDEAAIKELNSRFEPREGEGYVGFTKEILSCDENNKQIFQTNPTSWVLLDFATMLK